MKKIAKTLVFTMSLGAFLFTGISCSQNLDEFTSEEIVLEEESPSEEVEFVAEGPSRYVTGRHGGGGRHPGSAPSL